MNYVMMEIARMEMDAHLIVKFSLDLDVEVNHPAVGCEVVIV